MASSPLVTTAWLEDHLADTDLRIVEVCSIRDDKTYHEGHIPGAMWVYWKSACWQDTDRDFVTPAAMAQLFGGMGIGPHSTVVLYGDPVQYGSTAFWPSPWSGTRLRCSTGPPKWVMEGRPTSRMYRVFRCRYPTPGGNVVDAVADATCSTICGSQRLRLTAFAGGRHWQARPIFLRSSWC
jgi:3-mercaptopyruvate sulfurtransferase SseA